MFFRDELFGVEPEKAHQDLSCGFIGLFNILKNLVIELFQIAQKLNLAHYRLLDF